MVGLSMPKPATPMPNQDAPAHADRRIEIRGLNKRFGESYVYRNFDLDLREGEFISIFGPNGCGKSTFINLISGMIPIDGGTVLYDGKTIRQTRISYVFQNYREALFPWMRAISNIQYPLKMLGLDKATRTRRVEELLAEFDIQIDLKRYPYELSGGQQQMISILRALVTDPEVLFLDEQLQQVFLKRRNTMILVSHDLEEAIQLANRVLMLTRRPTRVAETVVVDVPWPRDSRSLTSPEFVAIKSRCLEIFNREVARTGEAGVARGLSQAGGSGAAPQ
jgi:NitT/TauT family transport system ATP-binding protein